MRWLLMIALVAVAVLSALKTAEADKTKGVAASKDDGSRRADSGKDQNGDRSGEKCREKDSESDKRMKDEWAHEEDRSTSRRYGKSVRAHGRERLTDTPSDERLSFNPAEPKLDALYTAGVQSPVGSILLALHSLWRHYVSFRYSAYAAPLR